MCWTFYRINQISKSVLALTGRFFSKSAFFLSNWSSKNVYFYKHSLLPSVSKILTTLKFLKREILASWINWRRLGFVLVWCARHLFYFHGHKSSFILNQLQCFIVMKNSTTYFFLNWSYVFINLCGYLFIMFFACN